MMFFFSQKELRHWLKKWQSQKFGQNNTYQMIMLQMKPELWNGEKSFYRRFSGGKNNYVGLKHSIGSWKSLVRIFSPKCSLEEFFENETDKMKQVLLDIWTCPIPDKRIRGYLRVYRRRLEPVFLRVAAKMYDHQIFHVFWMRRRRVWVSMRFFFSIESRSATPSKQIYDEIRRTWRDASKGVKLYGIPPNEEIFFFCLIFWNILTAKLSEHQLQ